MYNMGPKSQVAPYAGLALGYASVKVKRERTFESTANEQTTTTSESKTGSGIGAKLFLGAELKQGIYGELEYDWLPKALDVNPSGFGLRIGYRF